MAKSIVTKELLESVGIDKDAQLDAARRGQVPHMEQLSYKTAIDATVMAKLAERFPEEKRFAESAVTRKEDAAIDRKRAEEFHKMVGTKPADYAAQTAESLKADLREHVGALVVAEDALQNVEMYGGTEKERKIQVARLEEFVKAIQDVIKTLGG